MSDRNPKIEKYYNYIIDDVIKETKVNFSSPHVYYKTPFYTRPFNSVDLKYKGELNGYKSIMGDYLIEKYGARNEDIVELCDRYFSILIYDWRELIKK